MVAFGVAMLVTKEEIQKMLMMGMIYFSTFVITIMACFRTGLLYGVNPLDDDSGTVFGFLLALVVVGAAAGGSFATGLVYKKFIKVGPIIFASTMGVIGVAFTIQLLSSFLRFFSIIEGDVVGPIVGFLISLSGAFLGFYLGNRFTYIFLFASVAFLSAYSLVRGVSLIFGGFVPEIDLLVGLFTSANMPTCTLA